MVECNHNKPESVGVLLFFCESFHYESSYPVGHRRVPCPNGVRLSLTAARSMYSRIQSGSPTLNRTGLPHLVGMIRRQFVHHFQSHLARRSWAIQVAILGFAILMLLGVCASNQPSIASIPLPFSVGEKLTYEVRIANGSKVGAARMWIEGPIDVRGTSTYLLRFDSRIRIAFIPAASRSSSWFDPLRGSSLRFFKHEQNPLTRHNESVDFYPDQKEWKSANGETGQSLSDTPLDELSFMYFIRTLPMTPGATYSFDRHFDAARNPTRVNVVRRETIPTPMGELRVFLVEMRVRDPRHYKGEGVIRIHLTDDDCRLPARIESTMPVVGTAVLSIDSQNTRCKKE
jgi:hypothetical protein